MINYFQHDFQARFDPKLIRVAMEQGMSGIGIYWCLVECLWEKGGTMPIADVPAIAYQMHCDVKDLEQIIKTFDLFGYDDNNFWSNSINRRMKRIENLRLNGRQGGAPKGNTNASKKDNFNTHKDDEKQPRNNQETTKDDFLGGEKVKEKENINNMHKYMHVDDDAVNLPASTEKKTDYKKIIELWNEHCPSLPGLKAKLSDSRKTKVRLRIQEMKSIEILTEVFDKMEASDFCKGQNKSDWRASFDWLMANDNNWRKVMEGNYDNRKSSEKNINDIWK